MVDPDLQALVFDNGSYNTKVGFSGDDAPRSVFRTVMANDTNEGSSTDLVFGDKALKRHKELDLVYPLPFDGGNPNFPLLEKLWGHCFSACFSNECSMESKETPTLMTDFTRMTDHCQKKMSEIVFEKFEVPGFLLSNPLLLSLYASGRTTGMTIDLSHSGVRLCVMYEGMPITYTYGIMEDHLKRQKEVGGSLMTDYLSKLLSVEITNPEERDEIVKLKEKSCYVSMNYKEECKAWKNRKKEMYELPDGTKYSVGVEKTQAAELLFDPSLMDRDGVGLTTFVMDCIRKCDIEIRKDIRYNMVLTGSVSKVEGLSKRLYNELLELIPRNARVKINTPMEREFSTWIGGSILTSLSTTQNKWLTKEEYKEYGDSSLKRKCMDSIEYKKEKSVYLGLFDDRGINDKDEGERISFLVEKENCFEVKITATNAELNIQKIFLLRM